MNRTMGLRRHLLDFSGTSAASVVATTTDAVIYTVLLVTVVRSDILAIGYAAAIGAAIGGLVHYGLCRFWVFRRFQASIPASLAAYLAMSWMAAIGHGALTHWLAGSTGVVMSWLISKCVFWIFWTYPLSRFVVFYDDDSPAEQRN